MQGVFVSSIHGCGRDCNLKAQGEGGNGNQRGSDGVERSEQPMLAKTVSKEPALRTPRQASAPTECIVPLSEGQGQSPAGKVKTFAADCTVRGGGWRVIIIRIER